MNNKWIMAFALLSHPVVAQTQGGAYKLIVASSEGGMVVVDYPTAARCERALAVLDTEMQRRNDAADAARTPGSIIVSYGWRARALCIPA